MVAEKLTMRAVVEPDSAGESDYKYQRQTPQHSLFRGRGCIVELVYHKGRLIES
jgi:hypothetical protein